ncbi:MAG TPA: cytochrome C oxidase subunit IV family protein [Acidimicrobiia bacterium]
MADTDNDTAAGGSEAQPEGAIAALEHPAEEIEKLAEEHLAPGLTHAAPGLLPGEVIPHPSPFKYVMIAVVLVIITAAEVALYYLEGTVSNGVIIALLLLFGFFKFALVAAWYMHLRTDQPIFRRFFVLGAVAAISLYLVVLLTLHVFE